jgi:biotin carboxylase
VVVDAAAGARRAAARIGFPCVVKPVANCGSRGVQRLESARDLGVAFRLAQAFNLGGDRRVLVEQALEGSKHTVEMIAWRDEWHLLSIVDTHYLSPRWPCETGLNTTTLSPELQRRAFAFAADVARRMGVTFGAHKVDVNVDAGGEVGLIELTARLSGGFHCQYVSPIAHGSHDIRAALKLAVGSPLDRDDIRHRWERAGAVRAVLPPPGLVTAIGGTERARAQPGVAQVFVWCRPGDRVGPYRNSVDRPAFVIAGGSTPAAAVANAGRGADALTIRTVPA